MLSVTKGGSWQARPASGNKFVGLKMHLSVKLRTCWSTSDCRSIPVVQNGCRPTWCRPNPTLPLIVTNKPFIMSVIMLNVIMMSVFMLIVTNKPFILSAIMLNVNKMSVFMLIVTNKHLHWVTLCWMSLCRVSFRVLFYYPKVRYNQKGLYNWTQRYFSLFCLRGWRS